MEQRIQRRPVSNQPGNGPGSLPFNQIQPPQQAYILNQAASVDQQKQQHYLPATYNQQPRAIQEPQYVPIPGTLYEIGDDGSRHQDAGATMAAQYNAVMINAGIAGNHKFVTERAAEEAGASDILLRWNFITDGVQPQYNFAMQRLGLPRQTFEDDCARLYRLFDDGRFGTEQETWCCGPQRMGGRGLVGVEPVGIGMGTTPTGRHGTQAP